MGAIACWTKPVAMRAVEVHFFSKPDYSFVTGTNEANEQLHVCFFVINNLR
jgi:O-glycosyl hydrolase